MRQHRNIILGMIAATTALILAGCSEDNDIKQDNPDDPWVMVWSDEFNDPTPDNRPDPKKWTYELGATGYGNEEKQNYTRRAENVSYTMEDNEGCLRISALEDNYQGVRYSSARIKTEGRFTATYGRFEARMKLPYGPGMWPAFWLLGSDYDTNSWPACGEIDIMENKGKQPNIVSSALHCPEHYGGNPFTNVFGYQDQRFDTGFHIFSVDWDKERIVFSVDGTPYHIVTAAQMKKEEWVFDHPYFIILNLAVGGTFGGDPTSDTMFPQHLYIDYVRVYQRKSQIQFEVTEPNGMDTDGGEWDNDTQLGDNDIADAKLEATVASDVTALPGYTVSGTENGYILDRRNGFSISYTENGLGGLTWTGNCHVTRTETPASGNATTHTYTFTNVKSDITVSYLSGVKEGDYLYDNGTWGKEEQREACTTIGRVFRVGKHTNDDSAYGLSKVRGYVVSLQQANSSEMQWFANQADTKYINALAGIPVAADQNVRESYYGGYRLTGLINAALQPYSTDWAGDAPFWYAFKNSGTTAPAVTSGWYIPTYAQLRDLCASGVYDKFTGTYWSSQVYPGTGNAAVGGVEEGDKNTLWAIRCGADQAVGYGWAIDRAKLITILTF